MEYLVKFSIFCTENYYNDATCAELFKIIESSNELDINHYFNANYNNRTSAHYLDKLLGLSLKNLSMSMSITSVNETIDPRLAQQYAKFCQEFFKDKNGNPTSYLSATKYNSIIDRFETVFPNATELPVLFSSIYIRDSRIFTELEVR